MTKINFNIYSFQNSVLPSLTNAIDNLGIVINEWSNMYVPRDFVYYNKIRELLNENINSRKAFIDIRDKAYDVNKKFDNSMSDISDDLRRINNVIIGKRESSIK